MHLTKLSRLQRWSAKIIPDRLLQYRPPTQWACGPSFRGYTKRHLSATCNHPVQYSKLRHVLFTKCRELQVEIYLGAVVDIDSTLGDKFFNFSNRVSFHHLKQLCNNRCVNHIDAQYLKDKNGTQLLEIVLLRVHGSTWSGESHEFCPLRFVPKIRHFDRSMLNTVVSYCNTSVSLIFKAFNIYKECKQ